MDNIPDLSIESFHCAIKCSINNLCTNGIYGLRVCHTGKKLNNTWIFLKQPKKRSTSAANEYKECNLY